MSTYSDWRQRAPMPICPSCSSPHLRSRDCPTGIEIECTACGWNDVRKAAELLPAASWPPSPAR